MIRKIGGLLKALLLMPIRMVRGMPGFVMSLPHNIKKLLQLTKFFMKEFFIFHTLVFMYVFNSLIVTKIYKLPFIPKVMSSRIQGRYSVIYRAVVKRLDSGNLDSISKLDIIRLAIRNMQVKKTRTLITVGGVSIGIGAIVFLVSVGYGLQALVISRVARLEELRQADITPQAGSKVKIDDKIISDIRSFADVEDVYPLIAVVGRVNYQNSISDMAVFGVTTGYLEKSAIRPVRGSIFQSNDIAVSIKDLPKSDSLALGQVAGSTSTSLTIGDELPPVIFNIYPNIWVKVREGPTVDSPIIGYTKRMEGIQHGTEVVGSAYQSDTKAGKFIVDSNNKPLGKWIKSKVYLWEEKVCIDSDIDCVDGKYVVMRDIENIQLQKEGYFAQINMTATVEDTFGQVLGDSDIAQIDSASVLASTSESEESTDSANASATTTIVDDGEWVQIVDENATDTAEDIDRVPLSSNAVREAVVNRAMLQILGILEEDAIGKTFSASFVIPTTLLAPNAKRLESEVSEYKIVGVTPDDVSPIFYVPFIDLRSLGVLNYSQLKVLSENKDVLDTVRKQIEAIGFSTTSVVDTVTQITNLFGTLRLVLGVMGMIALGVASLGMFNTLTVSLLERSREVGLMKAMGMTTAEVQELFLTESIIMGFCAGFFGLFTGWVGGKLLSLLLTFFSVFKGQGFINISYIPFSFVVAILVLSFFVGVGTGIFPARRSKKISALDALRYE